MAEPNEGSGPDTELISSSQDNCCDSQNSSISAVGPIFSSPKLLLTGASSNPFAMRSSPNRMSDSGDTNTASSIIAPSKFGALASSASFSTNPSSLHDSSDAPECNGASTSSKPLLRPSLIGAASLASSGSVAAAASTASVAAAPVAAAPANQSSILKPAVLSNPFCSKLTEAANTDDATATTSAATASDNPITEKAAPTTSFLQPSRLNHDSAEKGAEITSTTSTASTALPLANLPSLSTANLFSIPASSSSSSNSFVFGQKLHERVANHVSSASTSSDAETFANGVSHADNMFRVIAKEKSEADSTSSATLSSFNGAATAASNGLAAPKSLNDSARELEEARAAKRKYDEVAVITGEEDEQNALQIFGKLFTFDKVQGTWIERGRGTLRLNDKQVENATLQSRLVMRTQGCLRVILNTKVWTEMAVDKTSSKSIRLTAFDGEQIRVFLLMASLKDTETLYNALEWRLATLKANQARANPPDETSPNADAEEAESCPSSPKRRSVSEPEECAEERKKQRSE